MSAVTVDRNGEGAWRVSAFVRDGAEEWLETRTYYFFTKRDAVSAFRTCMRANGWVIYA